MDLPLPGFCLLWFSSDAAMAVAVMVTVQDARSRGVAVSVIGVGRSHGPLHVGLTWVDDADGRIAARYGVDSTDVAAAYLIRPDQHVCARWRELTPQRLEAALRRAVPPTITAQSGVAA